MLSRPRGLRNSLLIQHLWHTLMPPPAPSREQQAAGPSARRVPSGPPSRVHDPASPLEDTASSRAAEGPRLLVVQAGPSSSVYNTRSQGSAPAINVIGEPLPHPQQHQPMEPLPSDSDSAPDAAPEHHQVQPSQPDQFSNRDLFFSDLVHEAAGAQPHHSAPPAPHRPVFGSPHFPPAAPYPASPLAQQLFQAAPTPAPPAAAFPPPVPSPATSGLWPDSAAGTYCSLLLSSQFVRCPAGRSLSG